MNNKEYVKDLLRRIHTFEAEINDIDIRIEELKDIEKIGPGSINYNKPFISKIYKINSQTENNAIKIVDKIALLEFRKRQLQRMIKRINNAINSLPEPQKTIIDLRYMQNKQWYNILGEVKMHERHCRRLESNALNIIYDIMFKDKKEVM